MVMVQLPPSPPTNRPVDRYREPTPPPPPEDMSAAWAFIWVLFAFKMATIGIIFWKNPGHLTSIMLVATTWFWLLIPAVALAGPLMFRWRLVKLRRRRAALRQSEWLLDMDRLPAASSSGKKRR